MNDNWPEQMERKLRQAAPEDFSDCWPIYIVSACEVAEFSNCDPLLVGGQQMQGITGSLLDARHRDFLEATARWRGIGYMMIIDPEGSLGVDAITCHEAAHCLSVPPPNSDYREELCATAGWDQKEPLSHFLKGIPESQMDRPPWSAHESRFIRCCLHLWRRWPTPILPDLLGCGGACFGLSSWIPYRHALRYELASCRSGSIRDLCRTPAPPEFEAVFAEDTEWWKPKE